MSEDICPQDGVPTVLGRFHDRKAEDPLVGKVFSKRYEIKRLLGEGGMGKVYVAVQTSIDREVALKVLHPESLKDSKRVARFYREAKAASQLNNPHVVRLYDFGVDDDTDMPFIAMELLHGQTLEDRLNTGGPVSPHEAMELFKQIAQALAEAEPLKLVHRDLKPENIFLTTLPGGEVFVKVMDFGIAKMDNSAGTGQLTATGIVVGTPIYMAPEQISGKDVDSRTDIYALGCILHEMLTGSPPYEAKDMMAVLMAHIQQPIPALPSPLACGVDPIPELISLYETMLQKKIANRPANVADFIDRIQKTADALQDSLEEVTVRTPLKPPTVPRKKPTISTDEAPMGLVTLVFTDIEGSTELWEASTQMMEQALQTHQKLMRELIDEHMGYEVKTEGDAFMVAFSSPVRAVNWCITAQRALQAAPWSEALLARPEASEAPGIRGLRVRMGVHLGEPLCRTDPTTGRMDYFGPSVNRAARVASAAHGGQILVTGTVWDTVHESIDAKGADLGQHRLKGLEHVQHLVEIKLDEFKERSFPPPRTLDARKTNLQDHPTSFVGRQADLQKVEDLFTEGARLVTLLGVGGLGKTRLCTRYGAVHLDAYSEEGGVWFCDLSDARSLVGVLDMVANTLQVPLTGGDLENNIQRLGDAIAGRGRILLILDNFEQVTNTAEETLGAWLSVAPGARFLITTRERLRIDGEHVYEVEPLDPESGVELFIERARAARPSFRLESEDRRLIRQIVERLDGIPLALELAAARVVVLPPKKLLDRLSQRFKLLKGKRTRAGSRQATLRGMIDWSWDLLEPHERSALAQCAIFKGGFFLDAAETIIDLSDFDDDPWVLDTLQSLRDKSLLKTREVRELPEEPRFYMYESIREYALERLVEQALLDAASQRHADYYLHTCEDLSKGISHHGGVEKSHRLNAELENLVVIHERFLSTQPEQAARALLAFEPVALNRGPYAGYLEILEETLVTAPALDPTLVARMSKFQGVLCRNLGRIDQAFEAAERGIDAAKDAQNPGLEALLTGDRGILQWWRGQPAQVEADLKAGLALAEEAADTAAQGILNANLGIFAIEKGDFVQAETYLQMALDLQRAQGNLWLVSVNLRNLASLYTQQERWAEAEEALSEALLITEQLGMSKNHALASMGTLYLSQGDATGAQDPYRQAVALFRDMGDKPSLVTHLALLGAVLAFDDQLDEARRLADEAQLISEGLQNPLAGHFAALAEAACELASQPDADEIRQRVGERIQRCTERGASTDEAPEGSPSLAERFSDIRLLVQLLSNVLTKN
ncbi:MAG: hypothetical protein CMH54_14545 [Myxococcales bacterium]|nr:hypothetical protein [Myxococcales bacterium]